MPSDAPAPGGPRQAPQSAGRSRNPRTHQAILDAAVELIAELGYQELSIERIAARAGVGKATIYRWWDSKSALVVEAMNHGMPIPPVPRTGEPRADLREMIRAAVQLIVESPVGSMLPALAADVPRDPATAERLRGFLRPRRDAAREVLHQAAAQGLLPADVDIEMVIDLYAGLVFYRAFVSGHRVDDGTVDQMVDLIFDGTVPRSR